MLTITDCIGMSGLSEPEVDAIAEHEHIPEVVAAEMGAWLLGTSRGPLRIEAMIRDDIVAAREHGHRLHADELQRVLQHFHQEHPVTIH